MFGKNNGKGSSAGGPCGVLFRATLRSLQLIMALAVCGLYGSGLNDARKNHVSGDPKWVSKVRANPLNGALLIDLRCMQRPSLAYRP